MIKTYTISGSRRCIFAMPCIQTDVMMIPAGRYKGGLIAIHRGQLKSKETLVKLKRSVEVCDF
jgi:hypothetical protein